MSTSFLQVKNNASGVLLSDIAPATSAATLAAGQGASFPSTGTFHVTIDNEILQVTSRATDILTLGTRGAESTTAASHLANADVRLNITARHLTDVGTAINTLENLTHNSGSYVAQDLFYASGTAQTARLAVGGTGLYLGVSAAGTLSYSNPGGAAWKPDQACVGTVNGTNTVYVVPDAVYIANSLQVSLNGQLQTHGSDFTETTPTGGTFTMAEAPAIGAIVRANYLISQAPSANADTVDGYHASSTPTAGALLPLTSGGTYNQSILQSALLSYATLSTSAERTNGSGYAAAGLTGTVVVPGNRYVRITAYGYLRHNTSGEITDMSIWDGAVATGTQIAYARFRAASTNQDAQQLAVALQLPAAGTKIYNVGIRNANQTGTASILTDTINPAFFSVELV